MPADLEFVAADPQSAAPHLDGQTIHLWRTPHVVARGRAPLVALLAVYLGIPEASVVLDQDARGKPRLAFDASGRGTGGLEFNWSHSGDYALIALSRGCAMGVDIERLGKNRRSLDIARRFFDPAEAETLAPLEPDARDRAFIDLWCAKEAVLKAAGEGLSFGLARLALARRADAGWVLARIDPALGHVADWRLAGFEAAPGYRGALAWRGPSRAIAAFSASGGVC